MAVMQPRNTFNNWYKIGYHSKVHDCWMIFTTKSSLDGSIGSFIPWYNLHHFVNNASLVQCIYILHATLCLYIASLQKHRNLFMLTRDYRIINYGYNLVVIVHNYEANYIGFSKESNKHNYFLKYIQLMVFLLCYS